MVGRKSKKAAGKEKGLAKGDEGSERSHRCAFPPPAAAVEKVL